MDFLNVGIDQEVDILLSDVCHSSEDELIALLGDGNMSAGRYSPSYSSESGIVSPPNHAILEEERDLLCMDHGDPFIPDTLINYPQNKGLSSAVRDDVLSVNVMASGSNRRVKDNQIERNRKNAMAARANRQKKKEYVVGLENQITSLYTENETLKDKCTKMEGEMTSLKKEVAYLRSVLANDSALSSVLSGLCNVKDVRFSSSFVGGKRGREGKNNGSDTSPSLPVTKKVKNVKDGSSGGICLHIAGDTASLELCSHCSQLANI